MHDMTHDTTREQRTMKNALGQDVPLALVRDVDKLRDELVTETLADFERASKELRRLKEDAAANLEAFLKLSAERFGVDLGGKKGNVTVYSYDGNRKIVRTVTDSMMFDEGLAAAKELIDQYLTDVMRDVPQEVRLLIERAFRPNRAGRIGTSAVLSLRSLAINDERWIMAMHAIGESLRSTSGKPYLRVYEKDENGNWRNVNMEFASL